MDVQPVRETFHVLFAKNLAVGFGTRPDFKEGTGGGDQSESMGSGLRARFLIEETETEDLVCVLGGIGWFDGPGVAFCCGGLRWR
jgi:hypothetical protein